MTDLFMVAILSGCIAAIGFFIKWCFYQIEADE